MWVYYNCIAFYRWNKEKKTRGKKSSSLTCQLDLCHRCILFTVLVCLQYASGSEAAAWLNSSKEWKHALHCAGETLKHQFVVYFIRTVKLLVHFARHAVMSVATEGRKTEKGSLFTETCRCAKYNWLYACKCIWPYFVFDLVVNWRLGRHTFCCWCCVVFCSIRLSSFLYLV